MANYENDMVPMACKSWYDDMNGNMPYSDNS